MRRIAIPGAVSSLRAWMPVNVFPMISTGVGSPVAWIPSWNPMKSLSRTDATALPVSARLIP